MAGRLPVFILGAPGTDARFLADALGGEDSAAVASVATPASVASLAESVPEARFVFLTREAGEASPPELEALDGARWCRVDRQELLDNPGPELQRVCECVGLTYDQALLGPIEAARRAAVASQGEAARSPFASASSDTFAGTLAGNSSSLLISTYQTHRLICARAQAGGLNTHFRVFDKPMGIAVAPGRIALGTRTEVWDLRDMPEAAAKLDPPGRHDACFLPRNRHVTGDIAVHDLAFAAGELWIVATAFSCLATLDGGHSFVPRWAPRFITRLLPEDRCHLNGLAVRDDRVAYVTALGQSDEARGWRPGKADGGVLIDVDSSEVVLGGLSMPHSPRWHRGRLWLLESGKGALCVADLEAGTVEVVAELPGFTRGLAFLDGIAFVGLSQIRESATFGELPLTRRLSERQCGVWMVDLGSGSVVGLLRFDDLVQEIFDVAILRGVRFPELTEPDDQITATSYALP